MLKVLFVIIGGGMSPATICYLLLPYATSFYLMLVAGCYLMLPHVSVLPFCYLMLFPATSCYLLLPPATSCYLLLHTATPLYPEQFLLLLPLALRCFVQHPHKITQVSHDCPVSSSAPSMTGSYSFPSFVPTLCTCVIYRFR